MIAFGFKLLIVLAVKPLIVEAQINFAFKLFALSTTLSQIAVETSVLR